MGGGPLWVRGVYFVAPSCSSTCERSELDKALPSVPTAKTKTFETAASTTSSDPAKDVQDDNGNNPTTIKPKYNRKKKKVVTNQTVYGLPLAMVVQDNGTVMP